MSIFNPDNSDRGYDNGYNDGYNGNDKDYTDFSGETICKNIIYGDSAIDSYSNAYDDGYRAGQYDRHHDD